MLGKLLNFRKRTKSQYVDDKAVADFTRVCEQTGLIDKLRKEPEPR